MSVRVQVGWAWNITKAAVISIPSSLFGKRIFGRRLYGKRLFP